MKIEKRDYQQRVKNRVLNYIKECETNTASALIESPTGCHAKNTPILMSNGRIKNVEDIVEGDSLMGEHGPVKVLNLHRGKQRMYRVIPVKGDPFIVNEDHILTLQKTNDCTKTKYSKIDISLKEWLSLSDWKKHKYKLVRESVTSFEESVKDLPLDPYFLGLLLGEGFLKCGLSMTTKDEEIVEAIYEFAKKYDCQIREEIIESKGPSYYFRSKRSFDKTDKNYWEKDSNQIVEILRNLGLYGRDSAAKFIPHIYKTSSWENRLELLAGLLDSNGYWTSGYFEISTKSKGLSEDYLFLARSLGFAAYSKKNYIQMPNGSRNRYYRISISGNCSQIPTRVKRKQASPRKQVKSVLRTGFRVEELGVDDYYGFEVDGNHRYLMGDFTLTHNSGKTLMAFDIANELHKKHGYKMLFVAHRRELLRQAAEMNKETFNLPIEFVSLFDSNPERFSGYELYIEDECQHDATASSQHKLNTIRPKIHLGLTATPYRSDHAKLCFATVIRDAGIRQLIREEYLAKFNQWVLNKTWTPENIARLYMGKPSDWGQSVAYFTNKKAAIECASLVNQMGGKAGYVVSGENRDETIERFKNEELNFIANVAVLTEGFDYSKLKTVFVRPSSKAPTIQMAGRVLRLHDEIPVVNVVQNYEAKFSFSKHATPVEQFQEVDGEWRSLQAKNLQPVFQKQISKLVKADLNIPKFKGDKTFNEEEKENKK